MVTAIEWWTDASYSSDMGDKAQEHNANRLSLLQLQDSLTCLGRGSQVLLPD